MIEQKVAVDCLRGRWFRQRNVGTIRSQKAVGRQLLEEATRAVQLGTSSLQEEAPDKEELELLHVSRDVRLDGRLVGVDEK